MSALWNTMGRLSRSALRQDEVRTSHAEELQSLVDHTAKAVASPSYGAREIANVAHGVAKSGVNDTPLFDALAACATSKIKECNPQQLANLAWAFAKARHNAPDLLDAVAAHAQPRLAEFKPQELSNLVWAYATAKHDAPALLDAVANESKPRLHDFNEQSLSITFWAYVTAKHDAPAFYHAITEQAMSRSSELTPQALSTMAWACATSKNSSFAEFLHAIAREAKPRLRDFTAQQLAQSAWAFAKADYADSELFTALAATVAKSLADFNSQDLANTAWALAKACHIDANLFASLARAAERCVGDFNLQDSVNTAWALAKVGQCDATLFAALAKSIAGGRLEELDATHIANIAWAFAKADHADERLFAALAMSAEQRVHDLCAKDLATIAWSFANSGQLNERLFAALAKSAEQLLGAFSDEDRDNAEWAFAQAGQQRVARQLRQRRARDSAAEGATHDNGGASVDASACGRIVIAGCGIGGAAAAAALQSRGFDVTVLETDVSFDARKQGYGLTVQGQGATHALGVNLAKDDAPSTSHYTFSAEGHILGFFGEAFGSSSKDRRESENSGRFVHIPRQVLRARLVEHVLPESIRWGCKVKSFACWSDSASSREDGKNGITVTLTDGTTIDAALLIGSDGIFSAVRHNLKLPGDHLNYVGLIVVLGILPTAGSEQEAKRRKEGEDPLLVAPLVQRRIFETVDGTTRIYAMPFTPTSTMWQLSFPYPEKAARKLCKDPESLKADILSRCAAWHAPIPDMLRRTPLDSMSGYPVYDRQLLEPRALRKPSESRVPQRRVTLMGDAAHPMTPFRAQGANQALSDAVLLADCLVDSIRRHGPEAGMDAFLPVFEEKMLNRSARMVVGSREKAKEMHSPLAMQPARKVQRETGGVDMPKAIAMLRAQGIGANAAGGEGGLDAVVAAAIDPKRKRVVQAGDVEASAKRHRKDTKEAAAATKGSDSWWRREILTHLTGGGGLKRKRLRKQVLANFSTGKDNDGHRKLFRMHLHRAKEAGLVKTTVQDGAKMVALA